jgi:AcrR family transcriptional regulator
VSRDDVIAAAVRVCDRGGLDGLTVAAVAGEVGCRPPSVYHHVDGLDGLQRAVALEAARDLHGRLDDAVDDRRGRAALEAIASTVASWSRERAGAWAALCRPVDGELDPTLHVARCDLLAPATRALEDVGVSEEARGRWSTAFVAACRGVAAVQVDGEPGTASDRAAAHDLLVSLLLDRLVSEAPATGRAGDPA